MKTLYISYFGLRQPLVQTQVIPYLQQLVGDGMEVSLLTFEPQFKKSWSKADHDLWRQRLADMKIHWHTLPYHKRPTLPATMYDILMGGFFAARLARTNRLDVIHARGHVAAAMARMAKLFTPVRILFDIRGFMPEEYTDGGTWPVGGFLYRLTKFVEGRLFAASDGFVVLTEKARDILFGAGMEADARGRPVEVIPCCVDLDRFHAQARESRDELRARLGIKDRQVLAYAGSLGTWYMADEMVDFFAAMRAQDRSSFFLVITQTSHAIIEEKLSKRGVPDSDFAVLTMPPEDVPGYLAASDLGISFIRACYSKQSSSPTKIAEYLAAGLPLICNPGVGDLDTLVAEERVGVLVPQFNATGYQRALTELHELRSDPGLAVRCRSTAARLFDLRKVGAEKYKRLYRRLEAASV